MPISKFGEKIARTLVDYLVENTATLDTSDLADVTQQAMATLSSSLTSGLTYFWSKPSPPSNSLSGTTPPAQQSVRMGKVGLERAREIARIFKVVYSETGLRDALSNTAQMSGADTRKSELITEGFGLVQPGRILDNKLTKQDCDNIVEFILRDDNTLRKTKLGQKIMDIIISELRISKQEIESEVKGLLNPINTQLYDNDNEIPMHPSLQVSKEKIAEYKIDTELNAFLQETALRRLIYMEASTKKMTLNDKVEWSTISPRNSASANGNVSANSANSSSNSNSSRNSSRVSTSARRGSGDDIFQMSPNKNSSKW